MKMKKGIKLYLFIIYLFPFSFETFPKKKEQQQLHPSLQTL